MKTAVQHPENDLGLLLQQARTPSEFLRSLFLVRKERNVAYSTRAFARDLGISQSLLSLVMSGKRPLTVKQAAQISVLLQFGQDQTQRFLECALLALPENSKALRRLRKAREDASKQPIAKNWFIDYELERFKALSRWYHLAILDLTTTRDFRDDPAWISRRLDITPVEAKDALDRLLSLGLLVRDKGRLIKSDLKIFFPSTRSEVAIRSFHQQMIGKALDQLSRIDQEAFNERQISSMTLAIPRSRVTEARARIEAFQKELANLLTQGECDAVYQFNVQLFPLTRP